MEYIINFAALSDDGLFVSLCSILETCWFLIPPGYIYVSTLFNIPILKYQKALKELYLYT